MASAEARDHVLRGECDAWHAGFGRVVPKQSLAKAGIAGPCAICGAESRAPAWVGPCTASSVEPTLRSVERKERVLRPTTPVRSQPARDATKTGMTRRVRCWYSAYGGKAATARCHQSSRSSPSASCTTTGKGSGPSWMVTVAGSALRL